MAARRQRFAQRRKAVGCSQEGLAERLGVDRSTVVRWEAGVTEPQPWLRPKLARVLQVSIEQLDELLAEAGGPDALAGERLGYALEHPGSVDMVAVARLGEHASGGAVETLGEMLQRVRTEQGLSLQGLAKIAGIDFSSIGQVERGECRCSSDWAEILDQALGADGELVERYWATAGEQAVRQRDVARHGMRPVTKPWPATASLRPSRWWPTCRTTSQGGGHEWDMVMNAAHESSEHAAASESTSVGTNALEQLVEKIAHIARVYVYTPPLSLLSELVGLRDRAYWLLDRTCSPLQQRDLYLVAGQSCGLLASASFDLGYPQAAAEQARAARAYAEIAGHRELCAWADGSLASVELWAGRPKHALLLAERGLAVAPEGTARVRLWSIAARAAALLGDEYRAIDSIAASKKARDTRTGPTELHDGVGGEFGFGPARQAFCNGSAYLRLGRVDETVAECGQAIELYAQVPAEERWYAAEAGSQADLATAHLLRGNLADAREVLSGVLTLHPDKRVEGVVRRVGALRELLTRPEFHNHEGRALVEEIEQFTAAAAIQALPSGPSS